MDNFAKPVRHSQFTLLSEKKVDGCFGTKYARTPGVYAQNVLVRAIPVHRAH